MHRQVFSVVGSILDETQTGITIDVLDEPSPATLSDVAAAPRFVSGSDVDLSLL